MPYDSRSMKAMVGSVSKNGEYITTSTEDYRKNPKGNIHSQAMRRFPCERDRERDRQTELIGTLSLNKKLIGRYVA